MNNISFDDLLIIAGGNGKGKSRIFNLLLSGFEGKEKSNFIINGTDVKKNEYHVFGISRDNTLDNELKLSSKTYMLNKLEAIIEYISNDNLCVELNNYFDEINSILTSEVLNNTKININYNIDKIFLQIFKSIEYKIDDIDCSNLSVSEKMDTQLNLYLNILESIKDNTILLIDDMDSIYTNYNFYKRLSVISEKSKQNNLKVIIFIKNEQIINHLIDENYNIVFIHNKCLCKLPNYRNYISQIDLYTEEEIEQLELKIKNEKQVQLINEYINN
nr:hypothetical protein [Caviibacter abscessus]